jgi:hypothetical protein
MTASTKLIIAGKEFNSRLMLGTGKYRTNEEMVAAIQKHQLRIAVGASFGGVGNEAVDFHTFGMQRNIQ